MTDTSRSSIRRRTRARLLALPVAVLVLMLVAPSCIAGGSWAALPSLDPTSDPVDEYAFGGVSCVGVDWCMTVDLKRNTWPEPVVPRIWDGSTWTAIASPLAPGSIPGWDVAEVECATTTLCAAFYSIEPEATRNGRFAIWDGSAWTQVPMEVSLVFPDDGLQFDCAPDGSCLFIGREAGTVAWDGTSFTTLPVSVQVPPGATELDCFSRTLCYAFDRVSVRTWDGYGWSTTVAPPPRPSPGPNAYTSWSDISCSTPTDCVTVGAQFERGGPLGGGRRLGSVAARYSAGAWTMTPVPDGMVATQVSCASPAACLAIGHVTSTDDAYNRAMVWIGNQWIEVDRPPPVIGVRVLSCGIERCMAVGSPPWNAPEQGPIALTYSWDDA